MNNVPHLRAARGLTQQELADLAGTTQPHISRLERGDEGVTLGMVYRIATALNVPVWELFADENTANERLIMDAFRALSHDRQEGWVDLATALLNQREPVPEMP